MTTCPRCSYIMNIGKEDKKSELKGGSKFTELINKIVDSDKLEVDFDYKALLKSDEYKLLNHEKKVYIYNKIQDSLPEKEKEIFKHQIKIEPSIAYFICNNCFYSYKLQPGTILYSSISKDTSSSFSVEQFDDIIHDHSLPRTRYYNCYNKKCKTYTDPKLKDAVFLRENTTNKLRYVCAVCKTSWNV